MGKEDIIDLVAGSRQDRILIKRDRFQVRPEQIEIRCRQCCEKAITDPAGEPHWRRPVVMRHITNSLRRKFKKPTPNAWP